MQWFRMPLMCWALYSTSWIQLLATPILAITLVLVILERFFGIGIFDPTKGGDPLLYQNSTFPDFDGSTSSGSTPIRRSTS